MTGFNNLRELAALLQPKREPVTEDSTPSKTIRDFDGLKAAVDDALTDLNYKLGEGGALESILDRIGLTDLDKHTDKDGKTILERLAVRTEQYRKEVESLLVEIELMLASDVMAEGLNEGVSNELSKSDARTLVKALKNDEDECTLKNGDRYHLSAINDANTIYSTNSVNFTAGDLLFSYDNNKLYQVLGFDDDTDHNLKYRSIKELLKANGVRSLKGLFKTAKTVTIMVRDLVSADEGPFLHLKEDGLYAGKLKANINKLVKAGYAYDRTI